jgi:regulator of RNase E activity RraA
VSIGFEIKSRLRRVDDSVVARFRDIPVANVSDVMSRMTAGGSRLRPMHAGGVLAGPALTVKSRPGDNLMAHAALNRAQKGDVLVIDAGGNQTNSIMGELMFTYAEKIGLAGVIIDGAIRDYGWVRRSRFPVFAAGVTHRGPYKDGPGELNVPIAVDGMVIEPGDLMLGDEDGVLCVPFDQAEAVHAAALAKHLAEEKTMSSTLAGNVDRSWVEDRLKALGCAGV